MSKMYDKCIYSPLSSSERIGSITDVDTHQWLITYPSFIHCNGDCIPDRAGVFIQPRGEIMFINGASHLQNCVSCWVSGRVCLLQVVQHHAASQQHGSGVCNVLACNTLSCVPCGLKSRKKDTQLVKMKQIGLARQKVFPDFKGERKQIILLVPPTPTVSNTA